MTAAPLAQPRNLDGVQLAILSKRFDGVCRKMANTLFRTGRSGVLNTARDFSCCVVTADNALLSAAESLPIHVLSGPDLMCAAMKSFHPDLARGDAFLHNSPYHGNSHPADHTIMVPVMDDDGAHRFTVLAKAHQADCGNALPTTYMGGARDVYEEGALIFPCVQRAIAELGEGCGMAEVGYGIPPSVAVISGQDGQTGKPFVNQIFLGFGGGAAGPEADAWHTVTHVGNAGMHLFDSVELDESVFPVFIHGRHFVTDSAGAGRQRGGAGSWVEYGPEGCDIEVGYVSDGTLNPALGARGGGPGASARQHKRNRDGAVEEVPACGQVPLTPGESIVSISCGGGGYGAPFERDPACVAHDAREQWISREAARSRYGVVLTEDGGVDSSATAALRREMASA